MKIYGLIIAGGFSSRADGYKMCFDFFGETMLERAIKSMEEFCDKIIVVGGYRNKDIEFIVSKFSKAQLVVNELYEEGMYSSVMKGFEELECDRFFFMPGDYPNISRTTFINLLKAEGNVVVPSYKMKAGHPVLIDGALISNKENYIAHQSLKSFLKSIGVTYVSVKDPGILMDVDTYEDYERVRGVIDYENNG